MTNLLLRWLALLAPYLAAVVLLLLPGSLQSTSNEPAGEVISAVMAETPQGPWQPVDLRAIVPPGDYAWLKVVFSVPTAAVVADAPPLGLFLSGTFSATANWNGVEVGAKGRPGSARGLEQPGPVDAVIHLPAAVMTPGNNALLLEMSSHYRQRSLNTVIHGGDDLFGLRLAPYSAEARRPLGYYAAPLLVSVLSTIALFVLLSRPKPSKQRLLLPLLLMTSLGIAAIAEIFRAFVAYPYPYHIVRLLILAWALVVFANALVFYVAERLQFPWRRLSVLAAGILVCAIAVVWPGPPEVVAGRAITIAVLLGFVLSLRALWDKHPGALSFCCALLCLLVLLAPGSAAFFDRNLYAATVPFVALLFWPGLREVVTQATASVSPALSRLVVSTAGAQKLIPFDQIVAINGAGNYAEIALKDGTTLLDDRSLKMLADKLPAHFYRVHRSHIVNLQHAVAVRSLGAGKYRVDMANHCRYPVSRSKVSELRGKFAMPVDSTGPGLNHHYSP